jgi:hypothetical protein
MDIVKANLEIPFKQNTFIDKNYKYRFKNNILKNLNSSKYYGIKNLDSIEIIPKDIKNSNNITIMVIFFTGKKIEVNIPINGTIQQLKTCIENIEGLPENQQRIITNGKQWGDYANLTESNIINSRLVYVCLSIRGGGGGNLNNIPETINFVDVNNTLGLKKRNWSSEAPLWRVASPGLCIEGTCYNSLCIAYKNKVISNHNLGCFDLFFDINEVKCPICSENVIPITCAFNNCWWKTIGMKQNEKKIIESSWMLAENQYNIFDETISGKSNWSKLWIKTSPRTKKNPDETICLICNQKLCYKTKSLECKHIYHKSCIEYWQNNKKEPCPTCMLVSFKSK